MNTDAGAPHQDGQAGDRSGPRAADGPGPRRADEASPGPWLTLDDIVVGSRFNGFGRTISEGEISLLTGLTTGFHQPLHCDAEWVRANTSFAGPLLPGAVIVAYAIGLISATLVYSRLTLAALGMDRVRARRPVMAGDTIRASATVASSRPTQEGDKGVVVLEVVVSNQRDETVLTFDYTLLMRARAVGGA